jgi:hypothetical protein
MRALQQLFETLRSRVASSPVVDGPRVCEEDVQWTVPAASSMVEV